MSERIDYANFVLTCLARIMQVTSRKKAADAEAIEYAKKREARMKEREERLAVEAKEKQRKADERRREIEQRARKVVYRNFPVC